MAGRTPWDGKLTQDALNEGVSQRENASPNGYPEDRAHSEKDRLTALALVAMYDKMDSLVEEWDGAEFASAAEVRAGIRIVETWKAIRKLMNEQ